MKLQEFKVVQSRVTVLYQPIIDIRKKIFELEGAFGDGFLTPQLIPVPDEAPIELPRIEFRSQHGHTLVRFAQVRADLITNFDANFHSNLEKCEKYIRERSELLAKAIDICNPEIAVTALALTIQWPQSNGDEASDLASLQERIFQECMRTNNVEDVRIHRSVKLENNYFLHTNFNNYRVYSANKPLNSPYPRLGELELKEYGLELETEINDRLAYHNGEDSKGLSELDMFISELKKVISSPPCY